MSQELDAYAQRVKKFTPAQIASTLKNYENLVDSPRWEALGPDMQARLEAMAGVLRDANGG